MKHIKVYESYIIDNSQNKFESDLKLGDNADSLYNIKEEEEAAKRFSLNMNGKEIKVVAISGEYKDEESVEVEINLNNGDVIDYNSSVMGYSLSINNKEVTYEEIEDLMSTYFGSTQTVIGDVLLFYRDKVDPNQRGRRAGKETGIL